MKMKRIIYLIIVFFIAITFRDDLYCDETKAPVEEISDLLPADGTQSVEEISDFQSVDSDQSVEEIPDLHNDSLIANDENEEAPPIEDDDPIESVHQDTQSPQEQRKELNFTKDDVLDFIVDNRKHVITEKKIYQIPRQNFLQFNNIWLTNIQIPINASTYKLQNFGRLDNNKFSIEKYPYAVALTRLYAGLGDYEKNFAHITFYKDEMLTIDNLNFRGDFRGISDYKITHQKFSDIFTQLDYNLNDFKFSLIYFSSDRDYHPLYYSFYDNQNSINDVWSLFNFEVAWKHIFVSYFSDNNKVSADIFKESFKNNNQVIAVGVNFDFDLQSIKVSGQHDFDDNLFSMNYNLNTDSYKFNTDVILFDNNTKIYTHTDINATIYKNLYCLGKFLYLDIVRSEINFLIENHVRKSYEAGIGFKGLKNENFYYDTYLIAKQIEYIQFANNKLAENINTVSHVVDVNYIVNRLLINLNNRVDYNNFNNNFYLLYDYYNELEASLTWSLKNDNKVSLGSRLAIISSILNDYDEINSTNHCIDIFFSIHLTKLFDIKAEFNNLTRRGHFGNEILNDLHFTSQIVWYFIN